MALSSKSSVPPHSSIGDVVSQVLNLFSVIGMVVGGLGVFGDITAAKEIAERMPDIVEHSGKTAEEVIRLSGEVAVQTKALVQDVQDGTDAIIMSVSATIAALTNRFTKLFSLFR